MQITAYLKEDKPLELLDTLCEVDYLKYSLKHL